MNNILIIALAIYWLHTITLEGMVMYWVRKMPLPGWLQKPLYDCPVCMSFWYGTLFYLYFDKLHIPLSIMAIGGASAFISAVVSAFNDGLVVFNYQQKNDETNDAASCEVR